MKIHLFIFTCAKNRHLLNKTLSSLEGQDCVNVEVKDLGAAENEFEWKSCWVGAIQSVVANVPQGDWFCLANAGDVFPSDWSLRYSVATRRSGASVVLGQAHIPVIAKRPDCGMPLDFEYAAVALFCKQEGISCLVPFQDTGVSRFLLLPDAVNAFFDNGITVDLSNSLEDVNFILGKQWFSPENYIQRYKNEKPSLNVGEVTEEEYVDVRKSQAYEGYRQWQINVETPLLEYYAKDSSRNFQQFFVVQVVVLPGHEMALWATYNSLAGQVHKNWNLHVIAFTEKNIEISDPRMFWHELGDDEDSLERQGRIISDESDDSWLCWMEAGDSLAPHAFERIAIENQEGGDARLYISDSDQLDAFGQRHSPFFKPGVNPVFLRQINYIGNAFWLRKDLFTKLGGFDLALEGAERYKLLLSACCSEYLSVSRHIPEMLFHAGEIGGHYLYDQGNLWGKACAAVEKTYEPVLGMKRTVKQGKLFPVVETEVKLADWPKVSVVIPNKNCLDYLSKLLDGLIHATDYPDIEIIIVDNQSTDPLLAQYLSMLKTKGLAKVIPFDYEFNYSEMINVAASEAQGFYILQLNNDIEIIESGWLKRMVGMAAQPGVGVVGARLFFPNGSVQHAGVCIGGKGPYHILYSHDDVQADYFFNLRLDMNCLAVTGAVQLMRTDNFLKNGGLNVELGTYYQDVDVCIKSLERKEQVVLCNFATLIHAESVSIKSEIKSKKSSRGRLGSDQELFMSSWLNGVAVDPYLNPAFKASGGSCRFSMDEFNYPYIAQKNKKTVVSIYADNSGCGNYRIIEPHRELSSAGIINGVSVFDSESRRASCFLDWFPDSIIQQRGIWNFQKKRNDFLSKKGIFIAYELDDLFHDLPAGHPMNKDPVVLSRIANMPEMIQKSDRLIVTTDFLANYYGAWAKEVVVVPNMIDLTRWGALSPGRRWEGKPRIGWQGGTTHHGDISVIEPVVKMLADEVDWVFFGMCPSSLRGFVKEYHSPVGYAEFASKLASLDLDLLVAPLEVNNFNRAKSGIKILEAGALGYPIVCTDIDPYRLDIGEVRVGNSLNEWVDTIRTLVVDRSLLQKIGANLKCNVYEKHTLQNNFNVWMDAWLP